MELAVNVMSMIANERLPSITAIEFNALKPWVVQWGLLDPKQLRSKFSLINARSGQIEARFGFTATIPTGKDFQRRRRWISTGGGCGGWPWRVAEAKGVHGCRIYLEPIGTYPLEWDSGNAN
ncbi:hypothetical protein CRG98_034825 [Punica granatum]|uniref:Uncharacterized protein n=1 Tax=Punica granatum TaxID=22663 RepID=A0A2I0ILK3_PUNGR|nr:hypothetical protein CRG98_034825 [Punica granatum]